MTGRIMPNFIEIRQGDSFNIMLQFKNNKNYLDISNSLIKMQVRNTKDNKTVFTKIGEIDDAVKGKAHILISPTDTKNLTLDADYITDIQITFANGEVHTIFPQDNNKVASFIVTKNVTE